MHPSKNPEIAPADTFLFFFLQRAVNIGKSTALLIENKQYQDAWAIARIAFEGRYFVLKFLIDPSIANKWVSFYILEKYREEYDSQGEAAAKQNASDRVLTRMPWQELRPSSGMLSKTEN